MMGQAIRAVRYDRAANERNAIREFVLFLQNFCYCVGKTSDIPFIACVELVSFDLLTCCPFSQSKVAGP